MVTSLQDKEQKLAGPPAGKGWDTVLAHLELAETSVAADADGADANVIEQMGSALELSTQRKAAPTAAAPREMAVDDIDDGGTVGEPARKRGPSKSDAPPAADILALPAEATPEQIKTRLLQAGVAQGEVDKHGPMVHATLADMVAGFQFTPREASPSRS